MGPLVDPLAVLLTIVSSLMSAGNVVGIKRDHNVRPYINARVVADEVVLFRKM